MEVGLVESVQQSVLISEVHQCQAYRSEDGNDGLDSHEECSDEGSLDDIGVFIAQLELVERENTVQFCLTLQLQQSSLWIGVVFLPETQNDVEGVEETT